MKGPGEPTNGICSLFSLPTKILIGLKDDGHYNTSTKYSKATEVSGNKESPKETSPSKGMLMMYNILCV